MTFQIHQMKAEGFLFPYIPLLFRLIETGRRHKAKYEKKQAIFSLAGRKLVPLPYMCVCLLVCVCVTFLFNTKVFAFCGIEMKVLFCHMLNLNLCHVFILCALLWLYLHLLFVLPVYTSFYLYTF